MWIITIVIGLIFVFNILANLSKTDWGDREKGSVIFTGLLLAISIILSLTIGK